jgi:hypothetical protein
VLLVNSFADGPAVLSYGVAPSGLPDISAGRDMGFSIVFVIFLPSTIPRGPSC